MNTFDDALNMFLDFCESDDVFSVIHAQLQSVSKAEFDSWYNSKQKTRGSMLGSGQLTFPTDPEIRMALQYELLRRIRDERIALLEFVGNFFVLSSHQISEYIHTLNEAITRPLARELSYRLKDISDHLPKDQRATVPFATIQVIHQATNVIQQNASGENITQTATQHINPELDRLFAELEKAVISVETDKAKIDEYTEIIASAKELVRTEKPKVNTIKTLFAALPTVASVLSITASILKMTGA